MTSPDSDPKYVAYSNYYNVIDRFNRSENFDHDQNEFKTNLEHLIAQQKNLKLPDDIFIRLRKILGNDHVFSNMNIKDDYCSYVNYWLNKKVRSSYHLVNKSNFDIFDKFLVNYNMNRFKNVNNSCYGYIKYLDDHVYNRMDILIYLYDEYSKLKSYTGQKNHVFCNLFTFFGKNYKTAVDDHKDDEKFFNKLKELKHSIERNEWATNDQCLAKYYLILPEPEPLKTIENSEKSYQPKHLPQDSKSQDLWTSQNLQNSDSRLNLHTTPGPQELEETQDTAERGHLLESHITSSSRGNSEVLEENTSQYSSEQRRIADLQVDSGYFTSIKTPELEKMVQNKETHISRDTDEFSIYKMMDTPEGSITVVDPKTNSIPQEGLMGKIQVAFSNISEYVEPVPLMGVSGGMGALFLLLRVLKI